MGKLQAMMRVVDVLKGARDIIAARWVQGNYVKDGQGFGRNTNEGYLGLPDEDHDDWGYCGDGALRRKIKNEIANWNVRPSKGESILYDAQKALAGRIRIRTKQSVECPRPAGRIWCFNDLPGTTKEIMLEVYDEAIAEQCELVKKKKVEEKDGIRPAPVPTS